MMNIGNESLGDMGGVLKILCEGRVKGLFFLNFDWSILYLWFLIDLMF